MFSSRCRFNRETVSSELTGSLLIRVNETDWTAGNWETLLMTHWRAEGEQRSSTCSKHWQRCAQDLRPEKSSQGKGSKGLPTRDQLVYILPLIITHVDKINSSNYYYFFFFSNCLSWYCWSTNMSAQQWRRRLSCCEGTDTESPPCIILMYSCVCLI